MRAALLLGALAGPVLAQDPNPVIAQAIERLMRDDADSRLAERELTKLPDRAGVIEAVERALADDGKGTAGKRRLLLLLLPMKRADLVTKALESESLSARRAAALLLFDRAAAKPILLAWIAEEPPTDLPLLVKACKQTRLAEAVPRLWKTVEAAGTPDDLFADALLALAEHPSPKFLEFMKARLSDPDESQKRVEACIDALATYGEAADDFLLPWLRQKEHRTARLKAAFAIRDPAVHRQCLLDEAETDSIFQRTCLYRLMQRLDDAALLPLLRDPRVTRHPYFAIRVDVCTALAAIEGSGRADVPLLLDYLVDEDADDKKHIVRSEAWLTLWTLTGEMHGAEGNFANPPSRGGREYRSTRNRPGVAPVQRGEIEGFAQDLGHMRTVRTAYEPK